MAAGARPWPPPPAATDPLNPTCPQELNWSTYRQMRFTLDQSEGRRVLRAEGLIDEDMPAMNDTDDRDRAEAEDHEQYKADDPALR